VITLALDTSTPSTTVALGGADERVAEAHDEVLGGERPHHAERVLALAAALLDRAALAWGDIERVAVGVGPGGYTGLRIGLATARGLALSLGAELVGVGTLRALAEPLADTTAVTVLDARRGEAFVAIYRDGAALLAPRVCAPGELAGLAHAVAGAALAVGDGALRFRELLQDGGIAVAPPRSELHRVSAAAVCRLAARGCVTAPIPDYLRLADAERALNATT
jgi:tRNA threonylcarbamoyladenosine biosynthesis protein TsaB